MMLLNSNATGATTSPMPVLPGIGQILIGDPQNSTKQKYIMLPEVTAIFPSITFASWASIFTGKLPNETGIVGNEFFARNLYNANTANNQAIPGLSGLPSGMVTLDADGGAFNPGGISFAVGNAIPAEFSFWGLGSGVTTLTQKLEVSAPNKSLSVDPFWKEINSIVDARYKVAPTVNESKCDQSDSNYECRTVSVFNQYARGVDRWVTATSAMKSLYDALKHWIDAAMTLDETAKRGAVEFISNYFVNNNPENKRKRFPAVFSVYLSGLDHDAHLNGMGNYKNYFTGTTDVNVKTIVDALRYQDEFENKIFVIVADHGQTAMPTNLSYPLTLESVDVDGIVLPSITINLPVEMSCELKLEGFNKKEVPLPEKFNNNLHIWELANLFQQFDPAEGWRLLVPKEIEQAIIAGLKQGEVAAVTSDINQANVIAAMNGPMAHVYLRGAAGWNEPNNDPIMLGTIADKLNLYFGENGAALSVSEKEPFSRLLASIDKILIRMTGSYQIFNGVTASEDGNITGLNTPGMLTELDGNQDFINASVRVAGMNHLKKSGDIVLMMKDTMTEDAINRYTTGSACKSWHGSLNKSDSYVPFVVAYPGGNKQELTGTLSSICPNNACVGNWVLSDLIKKILEPQYSGQ